MISDKIKLEYDAIQSLQEMQSFEDGDDIDDFNKGKSPFHISGWNSPNQTIKKTNALTPQRKKQRNFSHNPQKGKSTLCHLGENIQKYHQKAILLKKQQDENSQRNSKHHINITERPHQKSRELIRKNTKSLLVDIPIECFLKQYGGERKFSGNLIDHQFQQEINKTFTKRNQDNQYNQHKQRTLRSNNQQFTSTMQQLYNKSIDSNKRSRQSIKKTFEIKQKQGNQDQNNMDLYCIEDNLCPNKDLKAMFNTLWKQQDESKTNQNANCSLEKLDCYSQLQPRKSQNYTEPFSMNTINDTIYDDYIEEQNINHIYMNKTFMSTKNHKLNPRNTMSHYKNSFQKKQPSISKDANNKSLFDTIKIQSYYESQQSTQESVRKSSYSSISKTKSTVQRNDYDDTQNTIHKIEDKEDIKSTYLDEFHQINLLTSPIQFRANTESQVSKKQNVNMDYQKTHNNSRIINKKNNENLFQYVNNQTLNKTEIKFHNFFQVPTENDEQFLLQNINFSHTPSYEVAHKSFKKYNIPITLRSHSLNKRQVSSRKSSNASPDITTNRSCTSNNTINDTLLFNIYKHAQVPSIQQKLNAFIQNQEENQKNKYVQYSNEEQESIKLNKTLFYSPQKSKTYYKYKPQTPIDVKPVLNNTYDNSFINEGLQGVNKTINN